MSEPYDALVRLFRPVVEDLLRSHLEARLKEPVTVGQIDEWAGMLKDSDAGRFSKFFGAKRLKHHRRRVAAGKPVRLMDRERRILLEKALKHVPPAVVDDWLSHLEAHAASCGNLLNLSEFDDSMRPYDAKPQEIDPRFLSFGVRLTHISEVLVLVHRRIAPKRIPDEARAILGSRGIRFE